MELMPDNSPEGIKKSTFLELFSNSILKLSAYKLIVSEISSTEPLKIKL